MALGRRRSEQQEMWVATTSLPKSEGHVSYRKLHQILAAAGFDRTVEKQCRPYYHNHLGRPSIPPGVYFRMLLVGYFEGIGSQRRIAWRCGDSLSLREFLGIPLTEETPDHSSLTRVRDRLRQQQEGVEKPTDEDLRRFDRQRKDKRVSNEEWMSPPDPDSRIAKMKDRRTHLSEAGIDTEIKEAVADKGCHAMDTLELADSLNIRTYIPERKQKGKRKWKNVSAAKRRAFLNNRRRTRGARSKRLQRKRSELVERSFAHMCDTGGARRSCLRGIEKMQKRCRSPQSSGRVPGVKIRSIARTRRPPGLQMLVLGRPIPENPSRQERGKSGASFRGSEAHI